MGIHLRPETIEILEEMIKSGMTNGEIQSVFSEILSPDTICEYRRKLEKNGLPKLTDEQIANRNNEKIINLIEKSISQGMTKETPRTKMLIEIIKQGEVTKKGRQFGKKPKNKIEEKDIEER